MKLLLSWSLGLLVLGVVGAGTGCKSPPPAGEGSIAWVEIPGRTPGQILAMARRVFLDKGYKMAEHGGADLVFEKPGSFTADLLHGGLDSGVVVRVFVSVDKQANGTLLLHCRADAVRDANKRSLEETERLSRFHKGTFEPLLLEVKKRLAAA
jgi:hypothetical protein